jgi:hypothetical protein
MRQNGRGSSGRCYLTLSRLEVRLVAPFRFFNNEKLDAENDNHNDAKAALED